MEIEGVSFEDESCESTRPMDQEEFGRWVRMREERGDINHYELLHERIVMTPPAGYPHGAVEAKVQRILGNFVAEHGAGTVFGSSQGFDLPSGDTVEPDASFV